MWFIVLEKTNYPCSSYFSGIRNLMRIWWTTHCDITQFLKYCSTYLDCYTCCIQFTSVAQSCPTLCNPMNHSTPGLPVHHQLPEFTQTHVHRVSDAIQPSHPLTHGKDQYCFKLSPRKWIKLWIRAGFTFQAHTHTHTCTEYKNINKNRISPFLKTHI